MTTTKHITAARLTNVRRVLTAALTGIAFWNSYGHTTNWFANHGQAAQAGLLAALPETAIVMVLLTLALGGMSVITTYIIGAIGVGSVSITIAANLEGSAPGLAGTVAALVAPIFAILCFALELTSLIKETKRRKTAVTKPVAKPASKPEVAVSAPKKRNRGVIDKGILWATQQPTWPSVTDIQTQFPTINRNTASRIYNAKPVDLKA
jgi:hypothetical protein